MTTTTTAANPRDSTNRGLGYLPGLDGIRAVAVMAVLLYHAELTWIPGGFLGVEVFFVISGYLITLLLLAEHDATGTTSLRAFWFRRARRLLPALYALLITSAVVISTFYESELEALRGQLIAALTYCTNWYLIVQGQSYFGGDGRPPLLQHLWSLAVEEQFYLAWPLILFVLVRVLRNNRTLLAVVVGLGALASALWMAALYEPAVDPSRVYYGTDTRASGLLLGAVLAFVWRPRELAVKPAAAVDGLTIAAVVGLLVCFVRIAESDAFLYRGGFVLVSVLTLVVIAGVVHPSSRLGRLAFGGSLITWIGVRSYGLYLWHWPIFVLTRPGIDVSWGVYPTLVLRLALTFLLAALSYRFVEAPIRSGALGRWVSGLRGPESAPREARRRITAAIGFGVAVAVVPVGTSLVNAQRVVGEVEQSIVGGVEQSLAGPGEVDDVPSTTVASLVTTVASTSVAPGATTSPSTASATTGPVATRTVTVLSDSVLLGVKDALTAELSAEGWQVDYRGKPAFMLKAARETLEQAGTPVGDVVVIGLGYNSLWEKDRANFGRWSQRFDREADELLATLSGLGAKRFVWVTLREPSKDVIPAKSLGQYRKYAWYFPYVNERLRALSQRRPDVVLADWSAISNTPGITYDAIHVNSAGTKLMNDLIRKAGGL